MYPVGVVFGMGFDTATEVALLATTALLATQHVPWYAILCLPLLFTAGMTLMDTTDGIWPATRAPAATARRRLHHTGGLRSALSERELEATIISG